MGPFEWAGLLAVVVIVIFFVMRRGRNTPTMVCNRCDGTGEVKEHWPDPTQPGGWHHVEGVCPKCKGKGKI